MQCIPLPGACVCIRWSRRQRTGTVVCKKALGVSPLYYLEYHIKYVDEWAQYLRTESSILNARGVVLLSTISST
jgi:hypothetical protein